MNLEKTLTVIKEDVDKLVKIKILKDVAENIHAKILITKVWKIS